jgi:tRNA A37 threonylcarbamoyladenosine synthetase subunit TsaC/SUA5/YrdC
LSLSADLLETMQKDKKISHFCPTFDFQIPTFPFLLAVLSAVGGIKVATSAMTEGTPH